MSSQETIRKVRALRLVTPDDPAYLAAMSEQALAHRRFGPKGEQSATYRVSGRVEEAVRGWLGARVELLAERVLAAEVLYEDERGYRPLFLELDAVEGSGGTPRRVYEVKFSSNVASVRRGFGQLARSMRLLGGRWTVDGVLVHVSADRGPLDRTDVRLQDVTILAPADLRVPVLPPRPLLRLELSELAAYLTADELALLQEARDEGDANVSARLERAARLEAGEPLSRPERISRPGATLTFGEAAADEPGEESPFAVLRHLATRGQPPADERP